MGVQAEKPAPRKRRAPPRRVPALAEQRERKPLLFGWGAHLNRHERAAVKERIALLVGIGLAVVLAAILGWGWYQDNIAGPAATRAENSRQIAQVGSYTLRMGFFKRFEKFELNNLNNNLSQVQQQLQQLNADTKHARQNAAQIAQLQSQQGTIQQRLGTLPANSLSILLEDQVLLQRSATAGVPSTPKLKSQVMTTAMKQAGGQYNLQKFINSSGLSYGEIQNLLLTEKLRTLVQSKLASKVPQYQPKVRSSHILIAAKNKPLAEQILAKVRHGANFAALAKRYSTDTVSAKQGGDLGFFTHGSMVASFDKAAFAMKPGEIRLVKSQYGWHIIKVTGRKIAHLTPTEYQQAQQSAYAQWLTQQEAVLHIQRFVGPSQLPNPSGNVNGTSPSLTQRIQQLQGQPRPVSGHSSGQLPGQSPAQLPSAPQLTGKSSKGQSTTGSRHKP